MFPLSAERSREFDHLTHALDDELGFVEMHPVAAPGRDHMASPRRKSRERVVRLKDRLWLIAA